MISFLPKPISKTAIGIYCAVLAFVSILFNKYMMQPIYLVLGVVWVVLFFGLSQKFSEKWAEYDEKKYKKKLFICSFVIRFIWVLISYVLYTVLYGIPFEYGASDSLGYHEVAVWFSSLSFENIFEYIRSIDLDDAGYPFYLNILYKLYGPSVIITRILKSLISSWMCLMVYELTKRNYGENVAKIAGVFCCLNPNLIMYSALHLKETEMLFLTVAAINRCDIMIRQKKFNVINMLLSAVLVLSLFFFRTVLGIAVVFAVFSSLVFTTTKVVNRTNRWVIMLWGIVAVSVMAGGTIANKVERMWRDRSDNQSAKRSYQVYKGVTWAQYATGTVMAPMMFVLPFATMVDVDQQYNQQMINGGNYVRNFLGIFVILSVFGSFGKQKNWRDTSLLLVFLVTYLGIICASGFSNSERFLLPGLPILLILSSNGLTLMDWKTEKYYKAWMVLVPVMLMAWAYFKLGARGIV